MTMNLICAVDRYYVILAFSIIFFILMVLSAIAMIIIVMLQQGESQNMGAITGGAESFFGKNKSRSLDAKLKRLTIYIAIAILVSSIMAFVMEILRNKLG